MTQSTGFAVAYGKTGGLTRTVADSDIGDAISLLAVNDGVADARAAMLAIDGTTRPHLLQPGTYKIASDMTLTRRVCFAPGAKLKPASGVTVTISGGFDAAAENYCFDTSASGSFVVSQSTWLTQWGADATGVTPCDTIFATAMQEAVDRGCYLRVSEGTYLFDFADATDTTLIDLTAGQSYLLEGVGLPVFKFADDFGSTLGDRDFCRIVYVRCRNATSGDVRVSGIEFDFNDTNNPYGADDVRDVFTGTWAISTAYKKGDRLLGTADASGDMDGRVYECTTAGTSSGSGTGPSGTGSGISDGTCVWDWNGNAWDNDIIEHVGGVFIWAGTGGTMPNVHVADIRIRDRRNTDGITVFTDSTGIVNFAVVERITATARALNSSSRGDVIWYHGIESFQIRNSNIDRAEAEYLFAPSDTTFHTIEGCVIKELDIGGQRGSRLDIKSCTIDRFMTWVRTPGTITSCLIRNFGRVINGVATGLTRINQPRNNVVMRDCRMEFWVGEDGAIVAPLVYAWPVDDDAEQTTDLLDNTWVQMGRAPHLSDWTTGETIAWGERRVNAGNIYRCKEPGTTTSAPTGTTDYEEPGDGLAWDYVAAVTDDVTSASSYVIEPETSNLPVTQTKLRRIRLSGNTFVEQGGTFERLLKCTGKFEIWNNDFACQSYVAQLFGDNTPTNYQQTHWRQNKYERHSGSDVFILSFYGTDHPEHFHRFEDILDAGVGQGFLGSSTTWANVKPGRRVIYGEGVPTATDGWLLNDIYWRTDAVDPVVDRYICTVAAPRGSTATLAERETF